VSPSEPLLEVDRLDAAWDGAPVLRSVSFAVGAGEFVVLLGPNGSGKTTLLRCLAGLERPTGGSVRLAGVDLGTTPTHRRGIGLMFQEPALFPNRSVYENIAYAPLLQRRPRPEVEREVDRVVDLLRLRGFEDRRPDRLSGGERQRVALARTLAARPRLVLLDEPFASIDAEIKAELHAQFRGALAASGAAAIHVTHDRDEGLFLADRVGLLFDGRLETLGPPDAVYRDPTTARAARFLGYNVLPSPTGPVAVHPTDIRWAPPGSPGIPATVAAQGSVGRDRLVVFLMDDRTRVDLRAAGPGEALPAGTRVVLSWERATPVRP